MPPRYANFTDPEPEDILIIHDFMDTLDQIPPELTRVHSDLNELGAVLYSTLLNLEVKLNTLIDWIQDTSIGPEQRFQLLQEIAEEAARYKLGGDDKIRVAGGACDGLMAHQRHISNLLSASSILYPTPYSPYTLSLTLAQAPTYPSSRRGAGYARAVNSPFGGATARAGVVAGANGERDTPTKKKKNRVQALGADDDVSSVGGEKKRAPAKKRKPVNRATSPADSLASASAFTGKPAQPQTARQLAAAANKAKKAERNEDSDVDSDEGKEGALGLDMGSREGSHLGGRSANATPVLGNATVMPSDKARGNRSRGTKRTRVEEDDGDEEDMGEAEEEEVVIKPPPRKNGSSAGASKKGSQTGYDGDAMEVGETGDGEVDSKVYCTCRQVSFGEMIGCDDDDCEIEWYHIQCVGLDKTPEGNWICPQCIERRKRNPKKKVKGKSRK